jgi:hypothetical protein
MFVTPLMVRFPVTTKVSPVALIEVDSKISSFVFSVSKKSALLRWPSRSAEPVSIESSFAVTFAEDDAASAPTTMVLRNLQSVRGLW